MAGLEAVFKAVADFSNLKSEAKSAGQALEGMGESAEKGGEKAGKSGGSKFIGALGKVMKTGAAVVGGAVATTLGAAFVKGFQRVDAIDQAQSKLRGLGHTTESVASIMDSSLASVKGTAFGLGEAVSTSAMMVATGIPAGERLTQVLKTVADTATIAGTDMGDMGKIFSSVAARGKLQGDDLMQLASRGVPVLQMLADHLGITAAEAQEMSSKGKISFEIFEAAMRESLGGAALESGTTFSGAMKNVGAALSRFGAAFLNPAFQGAKPLLAGITAAIDAATKAVGPLADKLAGFAVPAMEKMGAALTDLAAGKSLGEILGDIGPIADLLSAVSPLTIALKGLAPILPQIGQAFLDVVQALLPAVPALTTVAVVIGTALAQALTTVVPLILPLVVQLAQLAGALLSNEPLIWSLIGAFTAFKAVQGVAAGVTAVKTAITGLRAGIVGAQAVMAVFSASIGGAGRVAAVTKAQMIALKVGMVAHKVATGAAAAAQWLLNAAMSANPIALVVIAIAALVAGLIWFFTQTEVGRQAWQSFMDFLIGAWNTIVATAQSVWGGITEFFAGLWSGIVTGAETAWAGLMAAVTAVGTFLSNAWTSITTTAQTAWAAFTGLLTTVWNSIAPIVMGPIELIKTFLTAAWETIKAVFAAAFLIIVGLFTGNFALIDEATRGLFTTLQGVFGTAWESIKTIVSGALEAVKTLMSGAWESIKSAASGAWEAIKSAASDAWNALTSTVSSAASGIVSALKGAWESVKSSASAAWNSLKTTVTNGISSAATTVGTFPGKAVSALSSLGSKISSTARSAWDSFTSAVSSGISNAISRVREVPGKAKSALGNIGSALSSSGRQLIQGLINGITGMAGAVASKIRSVVSGAISAAKRALGIASPSKVFLAIGKFVGEGLGLGVEKMEKVVAKAGDALASAAIPDVSTMNDALSRAFERIRTPDDLLKAAVALDSTSMSSVYWDVPAASTAVTADRGQSGPDEKVTINVTNHYPQEEPTSVTVNRGLQHAAAIGVL